MTDDEKEWKASLNLLSSHVAHQQAAARQLQTMPSLVAKIRGAIDTETKLQEEQQKRSAVLAGLTQSLFDQIADAKAKGAALQSRLDDVKRDRAACVAKDSAVDGLRQQLWKRRSEARDLADRLANRQSILKSKQEELARIRAQLAEMSSGDQGCDDVVASAAVSSSSRDHLGSYLPSPTAEDEPKSVDVDAGLVSSLSVHVSHISLHETSLMDVSTVCGTSPTPQDHVSSALSDSAAASAVSPRPLIGNKVLDFASRDAWLSQIRPVGPVLPPFVACPFTEFANLGAHFIKNPYRSTTEALVQNVVHSSPLPPSVDSFDGEADRQLYGTEDLSAKTAELEQTVMMHLQRLEQARKEYSSTHPASRAR
jgi:hypothetical protein